MRVLSLLMLLLGATAAFAHSDLEKPLFVALNGEDSGNCQDVTAACGSIAYALSNAGKGGVIRVTAGRYAIDSENTLFYLVSGVVDVRGGFDPVTGEASGAMTTLTGVPAEYRAELTARGFHVVADLKADATVTQAMLDKRESMLAGLKTAPCQSGQVNGLDCQGVDLLSHIPLGDFSADPGASADVWGYIDLNTGREYAFIGFDIGVAVVDVSDPETPREVGFIDGQETVWRDIKIQQDFSSSSGRWESYAYVTTDGVGDGLFVIDLTGLPHTIRRINYASDFSQAHNVFAVNTDYATGLPIENAEQGLVIAGSNAGTGILRNYGLSVPDDPFLSAAPGPAETSCGSAGCYMHDAASMIIRDSRISQCPNATDYCEVLFDFNESTIDLWDITRLDAPVQLSRTPYLGSRYTHSGWPSEDKQSLFVHDELDERGRGIRTTVYSFSLASLTAPVQIGSWVGPNPAIDHNGFVRGNRYYMSNYSDGLTVLDITDPAAPTRAGFLDTYPFGTSANFVGAWGAYPYFPSGNIAISDIDTGFYLADDKTLDVPQGNLSFSADSYGGDEATTLALTVNRSGGTTGAVSVDYEVLYGTASRDDVNTSTGTLNWADGDSTSRNIDVELLGDGSSEGLELLFVRLIAPTGGATLETPSTASVHISEPGAASALAFDFASIDIAERGFGTAVAVVRRDGSAIGSASVDFTTSAVSADAGSDFVGPQSGTLSWADGDATPQWIEFEIVDDGNAEPSETFEITLSNATGASVGGESDLTVTILDADGANADPVANAGASSTVTGGSSVTLDGSASSDPDGDTLTYRWSQTLGPTVSIASADTATASFTAPSVAADTLLNFELEVSDPRGASDTASVSVTVSAPSSPSTGGGTGGGGGGAGPLWLLALLMLTLGLRRRLIEA
ncbi:MAG: choice-of-anchor B family protein [Pseudomonadota bacterium]